VLASTASILPLREWKPSKAPNKGSKQKSNLDQHIHREHAQAPPLNHSVEDAPPGDMAATLENGPTLPDCTLQDACIINDQGVLIVTGGEAKM